MAGWMTTNLEPSGMKEGGYTWRFNLDAIPELLRSYGATNCWQIVDRLAGEVDFRFLRAEKSERWTDAVCAEFTKRAEKQGVYMHLLPDSGHWVHVDNPKLLAEILQKHL